MERVGILFPPNISAYLRKSADGFSDFSFGIMEIEKVIQQQLDAIECEHGITFLYTCESGSRAWGFASPDSDYDVRFIYARPVESYLSIKPLSDVIELPVDDMLDISGWDIGKALRLLYKSNAPLLEWLQSPIVYRERTGVATQLRALAPQYFSPRAGIHHYTNMAYNAVVQLDGEAVPLKKYFYALRPMLAAQWIVEHGTIPPMKFHVLRQQLHVPSSVSEEIDRLLVLKAATDERATLAPVPLLNNYIRHNLDTYKQAAAVLPVPNTTTDALDTLFRDIVQERRA